jgi:deoxycytidylate deaminase
MKFLNCLILTIVMCLIIFYGHTIVKNQRIIATGINSIILQLSHMPPCPKPERVFSDTSSDIPHKTKKEIKVPKISLPFFPDFKIQNEKAE